MNNPSEYSYTISKTVSLSVTFGIWSEVSESTKVGASGKIVSASVSTSATRKMSFSISAGISSTTTIGNTIITPVGAPTNADVDTFINQNGAVFVTYHQP